MNMCAASDSFAKDLSQHSASRVEEQLAFIDKVCSLLIESRFGDGFTYSQFTDVAVPANVEGQLPSNCGDRWVPLHAFAPRPSAIDMDIDLSFFHRFIAPESVSPIAPGTRGVPEEAHPRDHTNSVMSVRLLQLSAAAVQPRGSPVLI